MFMSYLYSKLPETGVSPHIGTGGTDDEGPTMMSDFLTRIGNAKSEDEIDKVLLEEVTRAQCQIVQAELNSIPCDTAEEGIGTTAGNASYALAKLK
jgi:hypothetical protein